MRGISFAVLPIRDHAFFKQTVLEGDLSASLSWRASARSVLTSSDVASRAVSPASRFLPASRNSLDQR